MFAKKSVLVKTPQCVRTSCSLLDLF